MIYSDGVVSKYIGLYLDHPECSWEEFLKQLNNQYGNFTNAANATRALIKVWKKCLDHLLEDKAQNKGLPRN